ncbi:MAG: low molecular weight protein arginine phosphatase [Gemmatimonadetes bacterium]|nr:low molecular weight protein arginine phosphatase [Gemmatimonadota bacterium]
METDNRPESFRLLFVCSGNTCRSPLAHALAERELGSLGWYVEVRSAGISALSGTPASSGSLDVADRHGLDLGAHRSYEIDHALIDWANLILVMSPSHLVRLAQLGGAGKAAMLDAFAHGDEGGDDVGAGVPDPFGGDDEAYEETYRTLEELVAKALRRLEPILAP